jgi:hypothetical protein
MVPARKILAKLVLLTGIALGLAALTLCANLLWPMAAAEAEPKNGMRVVFLIFIAGFGALGLIVWPFAWIAERIDPPQQGDTTTDSEAAPKAARGSRPAPSRVWRRAKQR